LFFFFFFFFQNVKRSLLLAKRRKGSGERIHTGSTEWRKKASFSSDARKKERKERPKKQKEVKKGRNVFLHQKKRQNTHHSSAFSSSFR
jgi:predicted alpha/beta superfamily hydrolase